jgi:hypothetical protein
MTIFGDSGRKPLTERQRQGLDARIMAQEVGLTRTFGTGGGYPITAVPGRWVTPEIPHGDALDHDMAQMAARSLQAAVEYATYGPGYWRSTASECEWVSLVDQSGNGITPPSAMPIKGAVWTWDRDADIPVDRETDLLLMVDGDGSIFYVRDAASGEVLVQVEIVHLYQYLSEIDDHGPDDGPQRVESGDYALVYDGNFGSIEIRRGDTEDRDYRSLHLDAHHIATVLAGWVMMHGE